MFMFRETKNNPFVPFQIFIVLQAEGSKRKKNTGRIHLRVKQKRFFDHLSILPVGGQP